MTPDAEGKVDLVAIQTGATLRRFVIDARELIACGEFVLAADYVAPVADVVADDTKKKR